MQNTDDTSQPTFSPQLTRTYDPPPVAPQFSAHNTLHHSPQQGSSNINIVQHVPPAQSQQTNLRTPPYTPTQTSYIRPSTFTINTIHINPDNYPTTSRILSRPPLPLVPDNPFSYNFSSTNINTSQQPSTMSHPQSNKIQINSVSISQTTQLPSTTIRTNPHINTVNTLFYSYLHKILTIYILQFLLLHPFNYSIKPNLHNFFCFYIRT